MKALSLALFFSLLMVTKWILAKFFYPFSYMLKDWIYGNDEIKNYTIPSGVSNSRVKWLFWLFLDDDQPKGYPEWYGKELLGIVPVAKWEKFRCAYSWGAWRNPAYNINYNYFSNQSTIVWHHTIFGKYEWDRKLRVSNGDDGIQLVIFKTYKGQERFLFSLAKTIFSIPITIYYGWNCNTNGRFTVAFKFK